MRDQKVGSSVASNYLAEAKKMLTSNPNEAFNLFGNLDNRKLNFTDFLSAIQFLHKVPREVREGQAIARLKVAVIGNCTLAYVTDSLSLYLCPRIFCETYTGEFDQWTIDLIGPDSGLAQFNPDIVVLYLSSLGLTTGATHLACPRVKLIEDALHSFAQRRQTPVVVILPEPLQECTGGDSEADRWYRMTFQAVDEVVKRTFKAQALTLDPVPTLLTLKGEWSAPRFWNSAKVPLHPNACIAIGRRIAQMVENMTYPRIKVVAVDCDNTLWGGEVGEVGQANVALSPFEGGTSYLRLQRLLKEASQKGILLVAVSKNEMNNVKEVFNQRPEMLLDINDFSSLKINWQSKSKNLLAAARELNLGTDSVLFIDDSPFERSEVQATLPDVLVAELPDSPDDYAHFISTLGVLERPFVSLEDTRRIELYQQEYRRKEDLASVVSLEDFLRDLQLKVCAMPIGLQNLDRVSQLVSKTNQFNLTTKRYTKEALATLAVNPDTYAYCFSVSDRFGDAGIIGVSIAYPDDNQCFRIDTLLLSCRVMGRTVENSMLEHLRQWLVPKGYQQLRGEYIPTQKNKPVEDLFLKFQFIQQSASENCHMYLYPSLDKPFENPFAQIIDITGRS